MFKVGDFVRVCSENENDCYDEFRGKRLEIVAEYYSIEENPFYDVSVEGMGLYEFIDEDGNDIPCALYEYELE